MREKYRQEEVREKEEAQSRANERERKHSQEQVRESEEAQSRANERRRESTVKDK